MNRKEEYELYLKTDRWKELRKQALQNASNLCQVCNSTKKLHVHHRQYPEIFGQEPLSFLTVLCSKCHSLFHHKRKIKRNTRRYYGIAGQRKSKAERRSERKEARKAEAANKKSRNSLLQIAEERRLEKIKDATFLNGRNPYVRI